MQRTVMAMIPRRLGKSFHMILTFVFFVLLNTSPDSLGFPSESEARLEPDGGYRITGDVYFGDKNRFANPCVLDRGKVFAKIPAYEQIKKEGLDKSSTRYYFLIEEANRVFRSLVKEVAEDLGYDLAVEKGGIDADSGNKVSDITQDLLKRLDK